MRFAKKIELITRITKEFDQKNYEMAFSYFAIQHDGGEVGSRTSREDESEQENKSDVANALCFQQL